MTIPSSREAGRVASLLADRAMRDDFQGWDPFDGLRSKIFQATPLNHSRLARLAWLQAFKRLPVNLRPLLRVPKLRNPKAVALCIRALILMERTDAARHAIDLLLEGISENPLSGGSAWGYPFDWQARAFYVPAGTPNLICTAYAVRALAVAANAGLIDASLAAERIDGAARFLTRHLAREMPDGTLMLCYVPGEPDTLVYNVVAWGAYIYAEAAKRTGNAEWRDRALAAARLVVCAQRSDGTWAYGTRHHHGFVDGFHTGYNLEALDRVERLLGHDFGDAIDKGLQDYAANFFGPEGKPFYFRGIANPVDCHSAAQGILTFTTVRPDPGRRARAASILNWTLQNMWDNRRGRFIYQRGRLGWNGVDYFRWTQSWMLVALATAENPDRAYDLG